MDKKTIDRDIKGLEKCIEGMEIISDHMREATLEFLWDKYVLDPIRKKQQKSSEAP
jgi:hypothetical protein